MKIGEALRKKRLELGLTQQEMCEGILSRPYYIPLLPSITSDCCRLDYYVSFLSKMV